MSPQVGFFFVTLGKELIRPGQKFPIQVTCGFPGVEKSMFCKFNRKTMMGTGVQTGQKALHGLGRLKIENPCRFQISRGPRIFLVKRHHGFVLRLNYLALERPSTHFTVSKTKAEAVKMDE